MDKIKIKLANPYLDAFDFDNRAEKTKILTFPHKPISFSPAFVDPNQFIKGASYVVLMENGKYASFYVSFLLSQITQVTEDYKKTRSQEVADGLASPGMGDLYTNVLEYFNPSTPNVDLNRHNISLGKSGTSINDALGRGVDLDIDYTYQLSFDDEMSTNAINRPTYVLNVDGVDTTTQTSTNQFYTGLNNWAGTSYRAFWCAGVDAGEENEGLPFATQAKAIGDKGIQDCYEAQIEAFNVEAKAAEAAAKAKAKEEAEKAKAKA